jgi:Asp/Glu/hydantoin racemase
VPFAASSLLQVASVQATLPPGRRVGVITFSADLLTPEHLAGAGAPRETPLEGVSPESDFYRMIIEGRKTIDTRRAEQDVVAAGRRLLARHPEVGAIVVECANMPPYSGALRDSLRLPVYDPVDFVHWFYRSLDPPRFG